jgi:two-component system nitrogen regulation response regulator GlnG
MRSMSKALIEKTLEKTFGNQIKAAKILGINRNTPRPKIRKIWD